MKKIIILIACLSSLFVNAQSTEGQVDCQKKCKVSRLVEEGVLLGVKITSLLNSPYAYIMEVLPKTSAEKSGLQVGTLLKK